GEDRHRDRQQHRTGQRSLRKGLPDGGQQHHAGSSNTSPINALRVDSSTAPITRAAARPWESRTTVDGTACGGSTEPSAVTPRPSLSTMEGNVRSKVLANASAAGASSRTLMPRNFTPFSW